MNLEDRIRSSARGQGGRYQPADDLFPRIEQRRRQRAARRITASAVGAVMLFGGGALALTSLRDRDDNSNIADSTEVSVQETEAPTSVATTLAPTTTVQPSPTTVATTALPTDESAPELNIPAATNPAPTNPPAPNDANVPSPTIRADGTTGLSEFWNVPSYGTEPVRGSGCGTTGQLGDTIPDGLWAGFIVDDGSDGIVGVDLLCIFSGEMGQSMLTSGSGTLLTNTPEYLIVNNSTRARFMPLDANVVLRLAERDAGGRCVDSRSTTQWADIPPDRQTWIRIHDGRITWIIADCPPP